MKLFTSVTCLIFVILVDYANTLHSSTVPKCCDINEVFEAVNDTYNCTEDKTTRLQININETGFIYQNSDGECVEVIGDFFVFNVSDKIVIPLGQIKEPIFPKCCPLNFIYNSIIHSCEEKPQLNYSYIEQTVLQIGLPNCRVIVDYELKGTNDYQYGLQDSRLSIHRRNNINDINSYCLDQTQTGSFMLRECKDSIDICKEIRCLKKCCPDGQSFIDGDICYDTYKYGLNISKWASVIENPTDPYAIIYNRSCDVIFHLRENKYSFSIDSKGVFSYRSNFSTVTREDIGQMDSYCMEYTVVKENNMDGYYVFECFGESDPDEKFDYTFFAFILSSICLTLTIAIYIVLNEIRKVFGKILVLYCIAMLLLCSTLSYSASVFPNSKTDCQITGYVIILTGIAAFSWSNILCWDIWCTFGSTKSYMGTSYQKTKDIKKIFLYILYGWGIPIVLTLLTLLLHRFNQLLPDVIQPVIGEERCFFDTMENNYSKILFFLFPNLVMELGNIFLFIMTASYCWKVRKEINEINDTTKTDRSKKYKRDKERLFLILKLSIIMGNSNIFEIVSAFFEMAKMGPFFKYLEIIWDFINALQGVYIFLIFCCKRNVLNALQNKFLKSDLPRGSTSTQSSQINNVSLHTVDAMVNKNGKNTW